MSDTQFDVINKAAHYNQSPSKCKACGQPIECIDVVRHFSFNLGNVIKYLWRAPLKGAEVQDLKKAAFYLNNEIELKERQLEAVHS